MAWTVAHLLPDIFVSVLVLSLFLLGFCRDALTRWERVYVFLLATGSASLHLSVAPVAAAVIGLGTLAWLASYRRPEQRRQIRPLLMALPLAAAIAGSLAVSFIIFGRVTLTPNSPPHFLSRILADGPGRRFLDETCPASGFELCNVRQSLPETEEGFLWVTLPSLPTAAGKRVKAEAAALVASTIRAYPLDVASHMISNAARQLVTFASATEYPPADRRAAEQAGIPIALALAGTVQARDGFEAPALDRINAAHFGVITLCAAASLGSLIALLRRRLTRPAALLATVLTGLLSNAAFTGAVAGVFPRFEGRVIWLLPFAVMAAALALRNSRVAPVRTAEPAIAS
ncbi:MAG: hypothetical protein RQ966_14650 [Acetobacteraceae bacterium]|nr:hypothetical protein [Acetobacteraceae bacterium]